MRSGFGADRMVEVCQPEGSGKDHGTRAELKVTAWLLVQATSANSMQMTRANRFIARTYTVRHRPVPSMAAPVGSASSHPTDDPAVGRTAAGEVVRRASSAGYRPPRREQRREQWSDPERDESADSVRPPRPDRLNDEPSEDEPDRVRCQAEP